MCSIETHFLSYKPKKTHNCRRRTEVRCVVEKSIAFFGEE